MAMRRLVIWIDILGLNGQPRLSALGVAIAYVCVAAAQSADWRAASVMVGAAVVVVAMAETMASLAAHAVRTVSGAEALAVAATWAVIATVYATMLPALDFRWGLGIDAHASNDVAVLWAIAVNALGKWALWCWTETAKAGEASRALATAAFLGITLAGTISPGATIEWQGPRQIEAFLASVTPQGSPAGTVTTTLRRHGIECETHASAMPGTTWCHAALAEYRLVFHTTVQAAFFFDDRGRLRDIDVVKDVDAP
jgi:hypothetical protein